MRLDVQVLDSNDHAPEFTEDPVAVVIPENTEPGASVYTFQAVDEVRRRRSRRGADYCTS